MVISHAGRLYSKEQAPNPPCVKAGSPRTGPKNVSQPVMDSQPYSLSLFCRRMCCVCLHAHTQPRAHTRNVYSVRIICSYWACNRFLSTEFLLAMLSGPLSRSNIPKAPYYYADSNIFTSVDSVNISPSDPPRSCER
jgi:hypothetical protein